MVPDRCLPPPDLDNRTLPTHPIDAGSVLYRCHRARFGPLHFGTGNAVNRFDDPAHTFGVCYLATSYEAAFVETFLREPGKTLLSLDEVDARRLASIPVLKNLQLAQLEGPALTRIGATAAVSSGPIADAQQLAFAIYHHPQAVDGIYYRVRHDNSVFGVALFDRGARKVGPGTSVRWSERMLEQLIVRYRFAV